MLRVRAIAPVSVNMIMLSFEMCRDLVQSLDMTEMPHNYIAAACYIDEDGSENVVIGDELDALMRRAAPYDRIDDINILLDLRTIYLDVMTDIVALFARIAKRIDEEDY